MPPTTTPDQRTVKLEIRHVLLRQRSVSDLLRSKALARVVAPVSPITLSRCTLNQDQARGEYVRFNRRDTKVLLHCRVCESASAAASPM